MTKTQCPECKKSAEFSLVPKFPSNLSPFTGNETHKIERTYSLDIQCNECGTKFSAADNLIDTAIKTLSNRIDRLENKD